MRYPDPRPLAAAALVAAFLLLFGPPAGADPAPGSLRLEKASATLLLTWEAGDGPYGVYRSPDAQDVVRPAWLVGGGVELFYEEPLDLDTGTIAFYRVADPMRCVSDADCDDGLICNGTETCSDREGACQPGTPIRCNDGNACTDDLCSEATGECSYEPVSCDDGDGCTLDECDPVVGCVYEVDPLAGVGEPALVAGRSLPRYPFFSYPEAFNEGDEVEVAVDPSEHPGLVGATCDVYVVEARDAAGWCADASLSDVRGAPDQLSVVDGGVQNNTQPLAGSAGLSSDAGDGIGRGYDVALDCNENGFLDPGELADGLSDRPGFHVVHDLTQPGPFAVVSFDDIGPEPDHCSGGGNDDMRIYYPDVLDDPGYVGVFPLVVISHGNGHCFDWYDFLGEHIASYGFIAMSHDNDTVPGIETASTTTLLFTDKILERQGTLNGGVLDGHIDSSRISWIGHSRGGEGVVRAYDRLRDEGYQPTSFTVDDIAVVSSIAPTDFLGPDESDPHDVPYHLLYGSADGDVCGCPNNSVAQSFGVYERARGARQSTYVHGADHNDFNCCGFQDFTGPPDTEIGREEAQRVQKAVQLALIEHYVELQRAAKDTLWRQHEVYTPIGVSGDTILVNEIREAPARRTFVVDDHQENPAPETSSSGGAVVTDVLALAEARLREVDGDFAWTGSEPMNGMTRGRPEDVGRGVVFEFAEGAPSFYELEIVPEERDFTDDGFLSFRAAQGTRHPATTAALEDLTFTVTLEDTAGRTSSIDFGVFGGGIEEPYQRTGFGEGAGWQNEFETIRIRLTDFLRDGASLDLSDVRAIRFELGEGNGSPQGRVALDDIELIEEAR